jgi:hypothetical protein
VFDLKINNRAGALIPIEGEKNKKGGFELFEK